MKINVVMKNEEKHNYCGELEGIDDINSPEDEEWARIINEKYTFGKPLNPIEKPKVVVVKGSPKSGFYKKSGHKGRPGQVGGSAPAGGKGLETFDIDPFFKKLYDGILPEDSPEFNAVVDAFNQMHHLDPEMLDGLDLISTRDTNIDPVFKQNENCAGYYASPIPGGGGGSLREICLNSDYRNLFDTSLAHELGHHIEEMNNLPSRPDSQRMFEGITTMQPAVWEAVKMSTGLREYSRTNPSEMLADMFMLYQLSKGPQVQALENVFQQHARIVDAIPPTLEELFNGE